MALNIKDSETDRLARLLARETGESITVAARVAIEERLTRVRAARTRAVEVDELRQIVERGRARRTLDERPVDEILGYDENGLPS